MRHTVGLADPLTAAEIPTDERLDDGFPQALEEYVQQGGVRYFKVKVCNQLDHDLQRLKQIAAIVERRWQTEYFTTLDGNEQYSNAHDFDELVAAITEHHAYLHDSRAIEEVRVKRIEQELGLVFKDEVLRNCSRTSSTTE